MERIAEIKAVKEVENGTLLKVFIEKEYLETKIDRYGDNHISLRLSDTRHITPKQRKGYYATLKDISDHTGHLTEQLHDFFKMLYKYQFEDTDISMSNCTVEQANNMIDMLLEFAIKNDVPLSDLGINRACDIDKYLYVTILNKVCSCCGASGSDLHHCTGSKVGMGNNRKKIDNEGRYFMSLCRNHHNECHEIGEEEFEKRHKVYGIKLDKHAVKKLKL